jgi:A/G-specific adenine glycosylase
VDRYDDRLYSVRIRRVNAIDLLAWYRTHARDLPWREEPRDPYKVVVSEFMLQQTQVVRVVPRFQSFVRRFSGFDELARAAEDEVLAEWSGLGYYRRARMLHGLAREVVGRPGGLPQTAQELEELPGIGPYTAAAVASLAFSSASPVLDGNVIRVGSRVSAEEIEPRSAEGRRKLESWVLDLMQGENPGEVNEALMELGATVCVPAEPACGRCPFEPVCEARRLGRQQDFPPPKRRRTVLCLSWVAACAIDTDGQWLLRRVDRGAILRGLWLPPLADLENRNDAVREATRLLPVDPTSLPQPGPIVRHSITHRKIDVVPIRFEVPRFDPPSDGWRWIDPVDPVLPTSSLLKKLVDAIRVKS